eukprot:TRINITY_DN4239_c0_g1_i3.p2 TRINITY_DN4239_c0_g1~~TRINITY_DN4239_c0_g1_i3.p2  ORF type:complete len:313 (-),score=72.22 TRINITY_DN4239_c0_g1_i3:43-981(-)
MKRPPVTPDAAPMLRRKRMTEMQRQRSDFMRRQTEVQDKPFLWFFSFKGTAFQNAWQQTFGCVLLAVIVTIIHKILYEFDIEVTGHTITIMPISFLLVFRTNMSHSRFWEGRGCIGEMVHHCRSLARKMAAEIDEDDKERMSFVARLIVALPVTVRWDLHKPIALPDVDEVAFLPQELKQQLRTRSENWPLVIMNQLTRQIRELSGGRPSPVMVADLEAHVDGFQSAWMGMKKIQSTPLPFPYSHLSQVLIFAWCYTLPFGLIKVMDYLMPLTVAIMSFSLFGLNQAGIEVELPFGVDLNVCFDRRALSLSS